MSVYLVTGGAGFIGSNLVHELLQRGETVRVLDNFSTGRRSNLADIYEQIDLVEGDLRSSESCRQATKGGRCRAASGGVAVGAAQCERPLYQP